MDEAYERNLYENTLQQEDFPSRCLFSDAERATARGSGPEACVITGGTPGQTRTDGARSGSSGRTASPVGLHRVIEPAGGIDAILNVKGHAGEKGLESYREMRVVNLGAQVAVGDLVARARAEGADAVLTSQVVTLRDGHILAAKQIAAAFADGGPRPLLVVGGPRFDPAMAAELGVDRVFGRGTTPREVASYLVHSLAPEPQEAGR